MNDDLTELMKAYKQAFGEHFPFECVSMSDNEIIQKMQECIEKNRPYEVEGFEKIGDSTYCVLTL